MIHGRRVPAALDSEFDRIAIIGRDSGRTYTDANLMLAV